MAAPFVKPATQLRPQPRRGNGTLSPKLGKPKKSRGRRRRRISIRPSSSSSSAPGGGVSLEVDYEGGGRGNAPPPPSEHQGKEPPSNHPGVPDVDPVQPRAIIKIPSLSRWTHHTQLSLGHSTAPSFHHSHTKRTNTTTNAMPPPHMRKKDSAACLPKPCSPNALSTPFTSAPTNNGTPQGPMCAAGQATATAPATTATKTYAATSSSHVNGATSTTGVPSTHAESVKKKLSSLGVNVDEPEPVTRAALVCYASSNEAEAPLPSSEKANVSDTPTPTPKPKSTAVLPAAATDKKQNTHNDHANASNNSNAQKAFTRPPPNAPTAPRAQRIQDPANNPAPSRGRRRGSRSQRKSTWIKNRDIPKPDPDRWAIKWTEDKDYRSLSSLNSDEKQKRDVPPGIDPETGFMLTGYDGKWAPPPLHWESRPAFSSEQNVATVEKWLDRIEEDMLGKDTCITQDVIVTADGTKYHFAPDLKNGELEQGDIAPHYWVPIVFATFAPSIFWEKYVKAKAPQPQHDNDLEGMRPWWEKYAVSGRSVLQPLQHPRIKGIDPRESADATIQRQADFGSFYHAENRKRAELAKIAAQEERDRKKREKIRKWSESHTPATREKIKTGAVLYLRLAFPEDMDHITEIYNHYVSTTVSVPWTEKWNDSDMLDRYEDINNKKLPFIVACEEGGQVKGRKKNQMPITRPDKIVGFAYADDHHDWSGKHRFTCDVEVYTAPDHYMKGVGKCLLDKMIGMLDPDYLERGGYRVDSADLELGALRVISNVMITVPYENGERLEWKSRCLTEWLGFKKIRDVKGTGVKSGQSVNTATFQRKTGMTIDAAQPPIISG